MSWTTLSPSAQKGATSALVSRLQQVADFAETSRLLLAMNNMEAELSPELQSAVLEVLGKVERPQIAFVAG